MNKPVFPGKFEVQGEIAQGKTGTIYYGYDLELRQEVAIKIYHSHINGRLIRGKPFIEKATPLLKLDHPNLIKIFKVEEDDGTPVVFMEFFDGPSLFQVIQDKGPLAVEHMLTLSRGIAEVLVHTHFQGIIHGTLHPGHVLVGPQQNIKVMDLGLSWILMDILSNCDEDLLRPLHYLPPESARGELLSLSSDLYSLGFMMYEMLTLTTPYTNLPRTSIMGKLAFDQSDPSFNFPEGVPEGVRDFIRQLTRNDPQKRLKDATHALTIINQLLARLKPTTVLTTPTTGASRKPIQSDISPKIDTEKPETSTGTHTQEPTPPPTPSVPSRTPGIQRPSTQVDYLKEGRNTSKRYAGFVGGIVALMIVGGSLGYWFRDSVDQFRTPSSTPSSSPSSEDKFQERQILSDIPTPPLSIDTPVKQFTPPQEKPTDFSSNSVNNTPPQNPPQSEKQSAKPPVERKPNSEITSQGEPPSILLPAKPPTPSTGVSTPSPQHLGIPPMVERPAREGIVEGGLSQKLQPTPPIPITEASPPQVPQPLEITPATSSAVDKPTKEVIVEEKQSSNSPTQKATSLNPIAEKTEKPATSIEPLHTPTVVPSSPTKNAEVKTDGSQKIEKSTNTLEKPGIPKTDLLHDPATQELLDSVDATDGIPFPSEVPKITPPQKP
ncbi:MAG: protein kinase [Nitrospirales bacterium]